MKRRTSTEQALGMNDFQQNRRRNGNWEFLKVGQMTAQVLVQGKRAGMASEHGGLSNGHFFR
jgi:hypothetical protein